MTGRPAILPSIALAALGCALIGADAPPPTDATAVIRETVRALAAQRDGLIAYHRHYDYEEYGPAHHRTQVIDSGRLYRNGALVAIRLYSVVTNGGAASPSDLASQQAAIDKQLPGEDYTLPLDDAGLADYQFQMHDCSSCPAGAVEISFVSRKRDPDHGDGTVVIDPAAHRVLRLEFHPSTLPKGADSGAIDMSFGQVLPTLWDLEKTTSKYTGHVAFMHGGANIIQDDGHYKRFATMEAARTALAAGI